MERSASTLKNSPRLVILPQEQILKQRLKSYTNLKFLKKTQGFKLESRSSHIPTFHKSKRSEHRSIIKQYMLNFTENPLADQSLNSTRFVNFKFNKFAVLLISLM